MSIYCMNRWLCASLSFVTHSIYHIVEYLVI